MKNVLKKAASIVLSATILTGSMLNLASSRIYAQETGSGSVQKEFFVAVDGSDENDGSRDFPFATVEKARQEVDKINDNMTGDIIVNIGAGDYYLENTIQFGESDSGTNGYEVIYRSSDGVGKANLIGGEKISGWVPVDETDVSEYDLDESLLGKVYKVQLDSEQYDFNTLYVNDERAVMARTRNRDNHPNFPMAKGEYMRSAGGHNNDLNMIYNAGDIDEKAIAGMVHAQQRGEEEIAQVFVWDGGDWDWFTNTVPIATIDTEKNEFKFPTPPEDYPEKYRTKYNIGSGARYFLQGNLAFMDVEGEYHYNKTTGILYYYPKASDGKIEDQTIIVPTMQKVLYFKGAEKENLADEPDENKQVHNITIDGLAVKDTEFADYFTYSWNFGDTDAGIGYFPKAAECSTNPSFCESTDREEFRVGSITLTGTHDITITNTRVKNSGLYGIIYAGDNQYATLTDSVIENTGYGGLIFDGGYPAIGKYNNHNTVENVLIHEVGELVGHAVGMTLMSSGQNTFTNMEIFDTPKRAILVIGGFRRDRNGGDKNYDEIKDMYTVGNHFQYIHVHDAQQDAGEDSAVFLSWLLAGKDVKALHGSSDPNNLTTNLEGIDTSIDRYNYFDQMLITDVGADPSVIEKCTVGGLDTAMGATGSQFSNIRAANTQHHLLAIRDRSQGDGYGDVYGIENCTNNLYTDDYLKTFDDSKMEYDKIGLTASFPNEYRVEKRVYPEAPDDLYFYDDFESSRQLDLRKWTVEKGELEMHIGYGYMSEDPQVGRRSLPINADLNPNGIVVSRTFDNDLNKIVEVKYLDRRKDYANNDRGDAVPTEILPNSFLRVDDGENALGLGAVGSVSKDYYQIKKGDELIQTNVKRYFGWHTFKFDYSSGVDVKLYIDDQLVATYDESDGVSTSFNYIGMGDWEGKGGKAFFDQLYVYGGKEAPPVEDLPLPTPPEAPDEDLFSENFESETPTEFATQKNNAQMEVTAAPDDENNKVLHVTTSDDLVYFADGMDWSNYTFTCKIWIDNWNVSGTPQPWDNMAPVWNAGSTDDKGNYNRYSLKYRRASEDFALYRRRPGSDSDMVTAAAPADYNGKWHDYQISTIDGLITAYVDGEKIFEYTDSSNPNGTIGFDGINVEYYVDDIHVVKQRTPDPTASIESGTYPSAIEVQLIPAGSNQDIFYTLDGSDPTDPAHGLYYIPESTITIDKTCTLKFAAIADGALYSNVVEREYQIGEESPIKLKFQLLSDVHVSASWDEESGTANSVPNFIDGMQDILEFAPDSDALVIAGDFGGDGSEKEFKDFFSLLEQYLPTPEAIIAAGNHDYAWVPTWEEFSERYLRYNGKYMGSSDKVYFDKWINGYHFITLNTEAKVTPKEEAYLSDEQLTWLREKLAENADIEKPIFVTLHQPLKGTFPRADDGWSVGAQDEALKEILKDYPQVVLMTGHIHNGLGSSPILETEYGTLVDVPSFAYNEIGLLDGQVGYEVDVYADKIQFRARDYKNDTWLTEYDTTVMLKDQETIEAARAELIQLYEQYAGLEQGDYDDSRWEVFANAREEAKTLIDNNSFNEASIRQAYNALKNAAELLPFAERLLVSTDEKGCTATATSSWWSWAEGLDSRYLPEKMIDRDYSTSWSSDSEIYSSEVDPRPTATLTWENPQTVNAILLYGRVDWDEVSVFFNGNEEEIISVSVQGDSENPTRILLEEPKENVTSISLAFENSPPNGMGFYEVEVYGSEETDKADKTELLALYEKYAGYESGTYTEESWSVFEAARSNAKAVLDNEKATQEEVDAAAKALEEAAAQLEEYVAPNKTLLQKTYDYALTLSTEGVTDSAKAYFEKVLAEAKAVLDNEKATQDEVNTAWDNLLNGIDRKSVV